MLLKHEEVVGVEDAGFKAGGIEEVGGMLGEVLIEGTVEAEQDGEGGGGRASIAAGAPDLLPEGCVGS